MKSIVAVSVVAAFVALSYTTTPRADPKTSPDISILVQNFEGPFVTRQFAERLGRLVVSEKYGSALLVADQPPEVSDKGDSWWVTIKVARWLLPPPPDANSPVMPRQLTIAIRKEDAAILSIK